MQQLNLITRSNKTIMYDQYCKMLIGHPYMLARIISCFVEEAKHLSLDEIKKLIKGVRIGDKIVNPHFHLMDKEAFIKDEGLMCYDIYFYIDLPQIVQSTKRVYINIEIQNNPYTKYHLVTRSIAYSSRMISSQWGREYDSENYDGMKKDVYKHLYQNNNVYIQQALEKFLILLFFKTNKNFVFCFKYRSFNKHTISRK